MELFGTGAWLTWLLDGAHRMGRHDRNCHGGVPSRRFIRWNTRHVDKVNMGQWFLDGDRRNMTLYRHEEAILWRLDVTPYVGRPYTLWEIDHDFTRGTALYDAEKPVEGGIRNMGRVDFYADADDAYSAFQAVAQGLGGYIRMSKTGEPPLRGGAWFRIVEGSPNVLYVGDDIREPMDVIDLSGRDVHDVISEWLAARTSAGLPRTGLEVEES